MATRSRHTVSHDEKLDFCCGGSVSIRAAVVAKALGLNALKAKLESLIEGAKRRGTRAFCASALTLVKEAAWRRGNTAKYKVVFGWEEIMTQSQETQPASEKSVRIPFMQRVLDNPFLLLFLGVVIPTVVYILWGVMEIANLPLIELVK
jgi:hypothetical protein